MLRREAIKLSAIAAERVNPLGVLLDVTRLLPPDAHVQSIRSSGAEWEVDGLAGDAAQLIPLFEESTAFAEVQFRSATNRVRLGNTDYERFALAFRYVAGP